MGECVSSLCLRQNNEKNDEDGIKNILENKNNFEHKKNKKKEKNLTPKNYIMDDDDLDISVPRLPSDNSSIKQIQRSIIKHRDDELKEKIEKARQNWQKLIDKLIARRIDIIKKLIKREKLNEESSEEEDEKIEDLDKIINNNYKEEENKEKKEKVNDSLNNEINKEKDKNENIKNNNIQENNNDKILNKNNEINIEEIKNKDNKKEINKKESDKSEFKVCEEEEEEEGEEEIEDGNSQKK